MHSRFHEQKSVGRLARHYRHTHGRSAALRSGQRLPPFFLAGALVADFTVFFALVFVAVLEAALVFLVAVVFVVAVLVVLFVVALELPLAGLVFAVLLVVLVFLVVVFGVLLEASLLAVLAADPADFLADLAGAFVSLPAPFVALAVVLPVVETAFPEAAFLAPPDVALVVALVAALLAVLFSALLVGLLLAAALPLPLAAFVAFSAGCSLAGVAAALAVAAPAVLAPLELSVVDGAALGGGAGFLRGRPLFRADRASASILSNSAWASAINSACERRRSRSAFSFSAW